MTPPPFSVVLSALALTALPAAASAQAIVQPLGTTDADRLAAAMRRLAVSPSDMAALIEAGEWSLRLGDLSGAASLFARADKIDPRNGRVKAGMGAILVRAERPGEALRYFQMAESFGLAPASFAADRGLAYDLVGEQDRAQRDYRLALRTRPDDETVRRYALSLGISGKRDLALEQLDPLLRHTDRAAWRARAFVLAMTGNAGEASRIATTMMPGGTAAGLQPFFQRLASLPPVDRAFAVHFGEVRATPERLADARMTPGLAALGPDPDAPRVALAVAQPNPPGGRNRRDRRGRDDFRQTQVQVAQGAQPAPAGVYRGEPSARPLAVQAAAPAVSPAAATRPVTAPVVLASTAAAPGFTGIASAAIARPPSPSPAPVAARVAAVTPPGVTTSTPVVESVAAGRQLGSAPPVVAPGAAAALHAGTAIAPLSPALSSQPAPRVAAAPAPPAVGTVAAPFAAGASPAPIKVAASITPLAGPTSVAPTAPAPALTASVSPVTAMPVAETVVPASTATTREAAGAAAPLVPSSAAVQPAITSVALPPSTVSAPADPAPPPAATRVSEDTILAKIVANLSIPAAELGVAPPPRPVAAEAVAAASLADQPVVAARRESAEKSKVTDKQASAPAEPDRRVRGRGERTAPDADGNTDKLAAVQPLGKGAPVRGHGTAQRLAGGDVVADAKTGLVDKKAGKAAAAQTLPDKSKKLPDKKAAGGKAGAAEKARADQEAADEKKAARSNPERIWVQVAGGASADDLPRAWATAKAKAPEAFAGRTGYTTPLRATNRVLAGPFKTDAEARSFVNQLSKKGVSAFAFTSDAGQPVAKLPSE